MLYLPKSNSSLPESIDGLLESTVRNEGRAAQFVVRHRISAMAHLKPALNGCALVGEAAGGDDWIDHDLVRKWAAETGVCKRLFFVI